MDYVTLNKGVKMRPAKRGTFHYHKDLDQQCRI